MYSRSICVQCYIKTIQIKTKTIDLKLKSSSFNVSLI